MTLFSKAVSTQAYAKIGLMGFAGSGKTYTATNVAIGLAKLMRERKLPRHECPIFFLDTETGSDYVAPIIRREGLELFTAKTRAFADLIPAVRESEKGGSILIIDSITHFWREFTESYAKKRNRTRGLEFQDWNYLKTEWGRFTDAYINSNVHIILCGRAGYEYDYFVNESGKKELEKTGIKMKAETELGYEPSLLVLMEREMEMETRTVFRTGNVLKERFGILDGKTFRNPKFEDFMPHIEALNLGGEQLGVDTSRSSESTIPEDGLPQWKFEQQQRDIALDEIAELLAKHYPGQTADAKKGRLDLLEDTFGSRSWERVKTLPWDTIKLGRNALWMHLEKHEYAAPSHLAPIAKPEDEQAA